MADLVTACRVCGCTEMDPCTVFAGDNVLLSEIGPCAWVEPDLCDNCDRLIDAAAAAIGEFTAGSAAARDQTKDDHARYTAAVNRALSEASGRLRRWHEWQAQHVKPLIQVVGG